MFSIIIIYIYYECVSNKKEKLEILILIKCVNWFMCKGYGRVKILGLRYRKVMLKVML